MEITIADKAGYCFGITNAINTVDSLEIEENRPVYMLGELSHNKQEMERLYKKGIKRIDSLDEIESGRVIIRTHGESRNIIEKAQEKGLEIINATCPFVKNIHKIIQKYDEQNYQIIIVGDKNHPEVIGSAGWAKNNKPIVIETVEEAKLLNRYGKICVVAQTTIIKEKFDKVTEVLKQKTQDIHIFNTICTATEERQKAAVDLAKQVDGMVVVGGYHSSNTQKLSELCTAHCNKTWLIETGQDINLKELRKLNKIGITAGASTPDWLIKEVTDKMEDEKTLTPETTEDLNEGTEELVSEEVTQDSIPENVEESTSEPDEQETEESVTVDEAPSKEETVAAEETVNDGFVAEETAEAPVKEEVVSEEVVSPQDTQISTTDEEFMPGEDTDESFDFASAIDNYTKPIHKNSVVEGTVLEISDDEVIVNIGQKSDALILKRDFTWKRDEELKDIVKVGDKVTAIVTDLNTKDNEGKYKLSKIKYDNQQINDRLKRAYENREVLYGKVSSVTNGHLWVDVGFTEIFMPASQYHLHFIKDLDALVGNNVRGILIDYEPSRSRAVLSQKVLLAEERDERLREQREIRDRRFEELQLDDIVHGKVKTITDFGVFVDLDGIDGFIHRSDLTWERNNEPKRLVKIGDEIDSKVILRNEDDKKIKLSVKDLQEKPWDRFVKSYLENDEIEVTITNTLDFGAFAQIIPGVEGLIHISEISYDRVDSVNDVLKTGDVVKVKIIKIDEDNEKISLSIKATLPRPERIQKTQEEADYEYEEYGRGGRRNNNKGKRNRRQRNNRDNIYYEENTNYTLGSEFGKLLSEIDFSNITDDEPEVEDVQTETESVEEPVVETETTAEPEVDVETETVEETEE